MSDAGSLNRLRWLDDAPRDLRHAMRLLRRNPIFTLTAVLSLAIGIGANTTIFTVANALLFRRPAGVASPSRLVDIGRSVKNSSAFNPGSYPDYLDIRQRATTLDGVYALPMFPHAMSLGLGGGVERVFGMSVSLNYFSVLGVVPVAGRLFDASDSERPDASPLIVLSYDFWTRRFAQDLGVVGRTLRLNGRPFTVTGVAPAGFHGTGVRGGDLWTPITTSDGPLLTNRSASSVIIGARLKPGVSVSEAAAEMQAIGQALEREHPAEDGGKGLRLFASSPVPGNTGPIAAFLAVLMTVVATVLAAACANLTGVLLARAAARRREIAVRLSLGSGRVRLIRQLLTETLVLFAIGAAAGLLFARVMTSVLMSRLPALPFPVEVNLALDGRVIAFTVGLSFAAALLSGLVPALHGSKFDVASGLKSDVQATFDRSRLRHTFVIGQVALSILLVIVAGLFVRALQHVSASDPGFDPRQVEILPLDLSIAGYSETTAPQVARELIQRARELPGVQFVTIAAVLPGGFERMSLGMIRVPGVPPPQGAPGFSGDWNVVEPGYFSTLKLPLVIGRDFTNDDRADTQPVVILGEGAARRFWPGRSALGNPLSTMTFDPASRSWKPGKTLTVVGVARDPSYGTLIDGTTSVYVYVPLQQRYMPGAVNIVVRTSSGESASREIRTLVASLNPNLTIGTPQTAEEYTSLGLLPQRIVAAIAGSLGLVGLLLAAIGIYGVTAYLVTCRTRELGIRLALGAQPRDIARMVLRQGMSLTVIGSVVGLMVAGAVSQLLAGFLFGLPSIDPVTFLGTATLFAVVGLVACYVPMRRAIAIDPVGALRHE